MSYQLSADKIQKLCSNLTTEYELQHNTVVILLEYDAN